MSTRDGRSVAEEVGLLLGGANGGALEPEQVAAALAQLQRSVVDMQQVDTELAQQLDEVAAAHARAVTELERYQALFAFAPDALIVTDDAGKVIDANRAATELFLIDARFLVGKPLAVFVTEADRTLFRRVLNRAARGEAGSPMVYRFERRGGVIVDGEVRVLAIPGARGMPTTLRWAIRDVTADRQNEDRLWELNAELERRVAERASAAAEAHRELSEQTADFEAILRYLPAGILVVAESGAVVARNERADELFGEPIERIESLAARLLDDEGRPLPQWPTRVADPTESDVVTLVDPSGRHVLIEMRSATVVTATETRRVFVFDDVTAQRQRDMAQRAFIVNAAHELRTPLAGIVSAIEVLQAGAKDDVESRDVFLEHIQRESDRLVRLARALLLLSRAQSLEEQPASELVPLRALLEAVAEGARAAPGVAVEIECPAEAAAFTSGDLLRQALVSIYENAVQHTPSGKIVLRAHLAGDEKAEIEIEDTGPGMTSEDREVAFQRFMRGGRSRAGFGLGLAIAYEAVGAMGGDVTLDSAPGEGTRVRVVVPAARLVSP